MTESLLNRAIAAVERGLVPDFLLRRGIRALCAGRARSLRQGGCEAQAERQRDLLARMDRGPVAPVPDMANQQHYELPPEFFGLVLGKHRKYSGCRWPGGVTTLQGAEEAALEETCRRAGLADGQEILELGCGWGSLSLWMAAAYPGSRITAVSNSAGQRQFIEDQAGERGLANLRVITADMNDFQPAARFDRVISVEMFEHMRNYRLLLRRIASWLRPGGKLFLHIFCHRDQPYFFETEGAGNWMGRYFFTGGLMPSDGLLAAFQEDLLLRERWRWNGEHYRRTLEAWLENLDRNKGPALELLAGVYGKEDAGRWFFRWRVFFIACAELFGFRGGNEWWVAHYLFEKRAAGDSGEAAGETGLPREAA